MPDEDDRPQDGSRAADTPWVEVVVPDDLRELSRDIAAYRREVRRADRSRRIGRLLARRGAVPVLALAVAAAIAGVVAGLLTLMAPHSLTAPPVAGRLAAPTQKAGSVGGLLPKTKLAGPTGTPVDIRSLRPAVIALVPAHCDCRDALNGLAGIALSEDLRLRIVVSSASDSSTAGIAATLERGPEPIYYDPSAMLATSVSAEGVTAVLIAPDGTIYAIQKAITDPARTPIEAELQTMLLPDRSPH